MVAIPGRLLLNLSDCQGQTVLVAGGILSMVVKLEGGCCLGEAVEDQLFGSCLPDSSVSCLLKFVI
jgi:hypothetical protein